MNAGIMSIIIYVSMVILVLSGWWATLLEQLQWHRTTFVAWLTLFVVASFICISPVSSLTVNVGLLFLAVLFCVCWRKTPPLQHLAMFSTVTLTGSVCYLIREIALLDPALLILPDIWLQAVVTLLLVAMTVRGIREQLAVASGGLTLGYLLSLLAHIREMPTIVLGDGAFFDLVWGSFASLIVMHGCLQAVKKYGRRLSLKRIFSAFTVASQRKSRYD